MARKSKTPTDNLTAALIQTFEPLVKALDFTLDDFGVHQQQADEKDTGHDRPSMRDNGLRFLISGICQTLWRQNYGVIRSKDGTQTYDNARQRLEKSLKTKELIDAKTAETIQVEDLEALRWLRINEERFHTQDSLLVAFKSVFEEIFHEEWKPYVDPNEQAKSKAAARNLTAEEKQRIMDMMGLAQKRDESRSQPF